jgi:tetratricopeptide (TPR) repeat protein
MPDPQSNFGPQRLLTLAVCLFLAMAVFMVFGQTLHHEFVNLDDEDYVYENPTVTQGLTSHGITWAFTHTYANNWHPLTWISHMLDCQLYGLNPGGHHLTSVLLHAATAILLFLVLRQMTGALWASAFVAAVFAIHPLRVESVAWVSERKDVLSGLFFMLTLAAYVRYARSTFSLGRYLVVPLCFAMGLMAKPMLVTLPFVLLLLDYWPLGRMSRTALRRLVVEKIPLFVLSIASCVVTIPAQGQAVATISQVPVALRLGNAAISYVAYLVQMVFPVRLSPIYPLFAADLVAWKIGAALVFLVGVSAAVILLRHKRPYLLIGWLWYVGMLAPVIGLVQVGNQARADRYTYLPQIGVYLLVAWAARDALCSRRHGRLVLGVASLGVLAALMVCATIQTSYWRNSMSLWTHALSCSSRNYAAHNNLGGVLFERGQAAEAIDEYQKALEIEPDFLEARYNLANALSSLGRPTEAIDQYHKAFEINPGNAEAHNNLGGLLLQLGRTAEAINQYEQALRIEPDYAVAHYNLGNALVSANRLHDAIDEYRQAIQIKPDYADAQGNLGNGLLLAGNVEEAIVHFREALRLTPGSAATHYNLGNALLQLGRVPEAIDQYQQALRINPDFTQARNKLERLQAAP